MLVAVRLVVKVLVRVRRVVVVVAVSVRLLDRFPILLRLVVPVVLVPVRLLRLVTVLRVAAPPWLNVVFVPTEVGAPRYRRQRDDDDGAGSARR